MLTLGILGSQVSGLEITPCYTPPNTSIVGFNDFSGMFDIKT